MNTSTSTQEPNSTKRERVDLINFVINAVGDYNLAKRFLDCANPKEVQQFFEDEGYHDIPLNDCEDIWTASQKMHNHGVTADGDPIKVSGSAGY